MISYLAVAVVGAVLYFLGRTVIEVIRRGGADEERAKEAEKKAEIARAQAEILAQPKTTDDTIRDLDNGVF